MATAFAIAAYACYLLFWGRVFSHALVWMRAGRREAGLPEAGAPCIAWAGVLFDIVFFRRLFQSDKLLWIGSWTFHASLLLVILRHLRYFLQPLPSVLAWFQPLGIAAGYLLPASTLLVLLLRSVGPRDRYRSVRNMMLLALLLLIAATGVMMRVFGHPDLIAVKVFGLGLLGFRFEPIPESKIFLVHFLSVLMLLPLLPFHLFAAPLVTADARLREERLALMLHNGQR